jgi:hypothetical protein
MEDRAMTESVYKVIELVGTSTESWEKAATAAVERAGRNLRNLRIAEIAELDMQIKDGRVDCYRAKVKVSFKYEEGS